MGKKDEKISRRKVIENLSQGFAALAFGGLVWGTALKDFENVSLVLRPPGALPETDFLKACIKCGQCVAACPYDTLNLASATDKPLNGTPFFEPREIPCYMCTNYPCIKECPSKALTEEAISVKEISSINNARMGLAVIHKESCIAYWGIRCTACYRACPLRGKAIALVAEENVQTRKHANLKPVINGEVCTGCGLCEHVCITEKPAVKIFSRAVAEGKAGDHYVKSWDANDEERLRNPEKETEKTDDIKSALDYLNSDDELTGD